MCLRSAVICSFIPCKPSRLHVSLVNSFISRRLLTCLSWLIQHTGALTLQKVLLCSQCEINSQKTEGEIIKLIYWPLTSTVLCVHSSVKGQRNNYSPKDSKDGQKKCSERSAESLITQRVCKCIINTRSTRFYSLSISGGCFSSTNVVCKLPCFS